TNGGDIGSVSQAININATTLTASAGGTGSVHLFDSATTDITLVDSGLVTNSAGNIYSLVAVNPGGTSTTTGGGAQISAPHISVVSLNGNVDVAVNSSVANSIDFQAVNGTVNLASNAVSVVTDLAGNGGSISLNASLINYAGSGSSPLTLSANA